jgi:hypothetical protein
MKTKVTSQNGAGPGESPRRGVSARKSLIHPVIIYPFRHPADYQDLEELYELVCRLDAKRSVYARPITVIDNKTLAQVEGQDQFSRFRDRVVKRCSDLVETWSVDTCQMWYSGMGEAYRRGSTRDVYWLIPGDFNYGTPAGRGVLGRLHDLPEICSELHQDLCIGEISTDHNNPKQLIDTYGTFALLYNWFPREACEVRQYTERPRSEFLAVHHDFLHELLHDRWYAYEQTVVMLLHAVLSKRSISRFCVGQITDMPEGRESLASALQQVERTERVLKSFWRDRHEASAGWIDGYRQLEIQSEQILRTAIVILHNLLD